MAQWKDAQAPGQAGRARLGNVQLVANRGERRGSYLSRVMPSGLIRALFSSLGKNQILL